MVYGACHLTFRGIKFSWRMFAFFVSSCHITIMHASMIKFLLSATALIASLISANAINLNNVKFSNEANDTTRITKALLEATGMQGTPGSRIAAIGRMFIDTPYKAGTLEGEQEKLTVNMGEMDCTTFVETVMALSYTAGERRLSWRDFVYNLERLRYRGGEMTDYASRLHYVSDWIVDNIHRGNLTEVTSTINGSLYQVKTLDFMSSNRDKYPQLADSLQFERIKNTEIGYRSHRYPYIKTSRIGHKNTAAALQDGDIVALTTSIPGLDVSHMGIVVIENGVPHLLHASSATGKVIIDKASLYDYMRRNKKITGLRVLRMAD